MVERYRCFGWDIRRGEMKPRGDGEWVLYSDYEALERQLAEARAAHQKTSHKAVKRLRALWREKEAAEAERDRLAATLQACANATGPGEARRIARRVLAGKE